MKKLEIKNQTGITLIALVVTIIVLIILAGIAVSMTVGDNGIFTKAKEAKRLQITAEAKEKIGTELLDAQVEAIERNEELEQTQVEDIISKYGTLQDDKDTIVLKDNGYEISLSDIYKGTTTSTGSYTELKAKVALLEQKLEDASKTQTESNKELSDLKALLAQTTATEDKVLKDYKAYSNGKLITGTIENYAGKTVIASNIAENSDNAEITILSAGYYGTDSKISIPIETIKNSVEALNSSYILKNSTQALSNYDITNYQWLIFKCGAYGSSANTVGNTYHDSSIDIYIAQNGTVLKTVPYGSLYSQSNIGYVCVNVKDITGIVTITARCNRGQSGQVYEIYGL